MSETAIRSRYRTLLGSTTLLIFICTALCYAKDGSLAPAQERSERVIVAFGDSLTEGYSLPRADAYPAQLQTRLNEKGYHYKVINAGISGETSSGALSRVNWILRLKPDIVILETGANDGFRGINPDLIQKNISEIIHVLKAKNVIVVLAGMQMLSNLGVDYTSAFKRIYPEIAKKQDVILVPFFLAGVAAVPSLNLPDTIHPTAEGYRLVTQTVLPYVIEAIKQDGR